MTWRLTYTAKPISINRTAGTHWGNTSEARRTWRMSFGWLAKQQRIPLHQSIAIDVMIESKGKATDPANCYVPCIKAAIDGVVDAGVIPDDGPRYVAWVRFLAPVESDRDAVTLIIIPDPTKPTYRKRTKR